MRRSELYGLEWDRVDLKRRQVLLPKTKNGTSRVVILTTAAANALEQLERRRNPDSPKVCLTQRGCIIGIDAGIVAGAGYGNIREPRPDEVGMHRGIDMDQYPVGGKALGTVPGDGVAVIDVPVIPV
jgi:hypothetical protein